MNMTNNGIAFPSSISPLLSETLAVIVKAH